MLVVTDLAAHITNYSKHRSILVYTSDKAKKEREEDRYCPLSSRSSCNVTETGWFTESFT